MAEQTASPTLTPEQLADLGQAEQAMREAMAAGDWDAAGELGRSITEALRQADDDLVQKWAPRG